MGVEQIKVSVRNLVEFVLRSGDLDSRFTGSSRAIQGTKAHQKIQKQYKSMFSDEKQIPLEELLQGKNVKKEYKAEVGLKHSFEFKGFNFIVEGRVDGIIIEGNSVIIDEIKTVTKPLEFIDENYNSLHWAQAKCYAYIYAMQNNLNEIKVQLTYYNINNDEIKYLKTDFYITDLEIFFYELLNKYYFWANYIRDWKVKRNISIKNTSFPFNSYRKGQRELAVAIYGTIREGKNIFAQAPTGIGKTISTLFPAIKSLGEGLISKIFYLTAKTITRGIAEECILNMKNEGLELKVVTLTAKEKICFKEKPSCNPEECEFAKGHFNRVNKAIEKILLKENFINRDSIVKYAKIHNICPFEFSLDLALLADCIICDYNYVFDPRVYLRRFFENGTDEYVFLIDEAHNLVDRARDMFSAEINKQQFLDLKKIMKYINPKIARVLDKINTYMIKLRKLCEDPNTTDCFEAEKGEKETQLSENTKIKHLIFKNKDAYVQKNHIEEIVILLRRFTSEAEEWLVNNSKNHGYEELLQVYFNCLSYIRISELYDDRFATFVEKQGNDVNLKMYCLDTSYILNQCIKKSKASIFFSATLNPIAYFKDMLGGNEEDYTMRLSSPFSVDNREIFIVDNISTKYNQRENSYTKIADYINCIVESKVGNYIVFFPSYKYMKETYKFFSEEYSNYNVIVQENNMGEEEKEEFTKNFKDNPKVTLIAFAVLGGIFSEGIDLKHDKLIGAVIVGVGLPQLCLERNIVMHHYNEISSKGYEYAYMYPGMNKVLQAAGRVIRTEEDKGVIILIDERFSNLSYKKLFPREWFPNTYIRNTKDIRNNLINFWEK
ncbi:ATP-dependent DNA helicase [Clostridium sp. DJ247]|uniref:ATP-dependent DNA helicase n=1 Tax=Clostridium sp. DJ247 TaxID=2726188 RepID=UPI0016256A4A|nr:ATP-dependent DNA helicase [Clostridium sp. DJ247]MBC2582866.1 ATP-dependent DNA helicase [Clostridium sp. DJ247]